MSRFKHAVFGAVLFVIGVSSSSALQRPNPGSAIQLNNLGVAYMNRGRPAEALASFRQALARDPSLFAARLNEGIALLNGQRLQEARDVLLDASRRQPDSARAWYNLGIAYRNLGETESALQAFDRVAMIDPGDADAFYFLGQLHTEARRYDRSIAMYETCLKLDPLHVSAEFGLARAYQLSGNNAAAAEHLARFDQLTQAKLGKPISLTYGEQGPYSTAEPVGVLVDAPAEFRVRFAVATPPGANAEPQPQTNASDRILPQLGPGACFIDFDADGRIDLLLPGARLSLYRNTGGGRFTDVSERAGFDQRGESLGCTVGDYDNDNRDDVVIGLQEGIAVYRNVGNGGFRNVTADLGIRVDGLPLGLTFVDYDHDGDLDLYVSRFVNFPVTGGRFDFPFGQAGSSNELWRNNGNGSFTDATMQTGLAGEAPTIGALAADVDNDRAIDFVLTGWRPAPAIFTNPREGPFRPAGSWTSSFPSPAAGVIAFDFNKDGWMDLAFTHWGSPGITIWKNLSGARFERLPIPEPQWSRGWGLTAVDLDNDGWLDLAAVGERDDAGQIRLLRNLGSERFADVTAAAGAGVVRLTRPRALIAGDVDGDGDADLLVTQNGRLPMLLRNGGGNRRASVRLVLRGLNDNRSAIGTKVEVFAGALRQKWEIASSSGYLGQNAHEIVAGINDARQADVVRLLWPTGVVQDEVQLRAGRKTTLTEIDRRGSSCPVLFVWNGKEYEFIADMIGPGIVGHWVGPGERNISDPNEYLRVEGKRVQPRNGRLSFRFAEVMEELVYLDHVRLLAIDHPADVAVYPNEYFAAEPPFPEFKIIASRDARPPRAARDDAGRDVLAELTQRDSRYVMGFDSLQYAGFAKMHYLELDLGAIDTTGPVRLLMHGFIDYFSATSVYAAHQAGVLAVVPFLDVQSADGKWVRAVDDIGFPAGLARTMVADLTGRLPRGTSRVRIGTNLKIYWDQILVDATPQNALTTVHEIPLTEARLQFGGYPRQLEGNPKSDVSYLYTERSQTGPYSRHAGSYTSYGDVLSLMRDADDRFAIIGSGDEVALEFDPSKLAPVSQGWTRDYFFYADGFAKDMDFYEAHSDTVEPLPFHAMGRYPYTSEMQYPARNLEYRLHSNTRYVTGNATTVFRFDYPR